MWISTSWLTPLKIGLVATRVGGADAGVILALGTRRGARYRPEGPVCGETGRARPCAVVRDHAGP